MGNVVWKRLPEERLEAFRGFLAGRSEAERPRYGLLGVKASWWWRLGGGARPFVVLFVGDRVVLSKRSFRRRRELTRREYPAADLNRVAVRRGPLLESVRLSFADGYRVRVAALPRHQARPLARWAAEGAAAFDASRLSPEQLTNFCEAAAALGLGPAGASAGGLGHQS